MSGMILSDGYHRIDDAGTLPCLVRSRTSGALQPRGSRPRVRRRVLCVVTRDVEQIGDLVGDFEEWFKLRDGEWEPTISGLIWRAA